MKYTIMSLVAIIILSNCNNGRVESFSCDDILGGSIASNLSQEYTVAIPNVISPDMLEIYQFSIGIIKSEESIKDLIPTSCHLYVYDSDYIKVYEGTDYKVVQSSPSYIWLWNLYNVNRPFYGNLFCDLKMTFDNGESFEIENYNIFSVSCEQLENCGESSDCDLSSCRSLCTLIKDNSEPNYTIPGFLNGCE